MIEFLLDWVVYGVEMFFIDLSKSHTTARTKESWAENMDLVPNSAYARHSGPVRRLVRGTDF